MEEKHRDAVADLADLVVGALAPVTGE
jgi:hypothetical protein